MANLTRPDATQIRYTPEDPTFLQDEVKGALDELAARRFTISKTSYTAVANQSTFTVTHLVGTVLQVDVEGISVEFSETPTSITLFTPASLGDRVEIYVTSGLRTVNTATIINPPMVTSQPPFSFGEGTEISPYVIPTKASRPGAMDAVVATITVTGLLAGEGVPLSDTSGGVNNNRFSFSGNQANLQGTLVFDILFSDIPTSNIDDDYTLALKIGNNTVYVSHIRTIENVGQVNTPTITFPVNNSTNVTRTPTITTNAFSVTNDTDTHTATDWQVSTNNTFSSIVFESINNTTNLTSITVSPALTATTTYFVRARHKGLIYGYSSYSPIISFTTIDPLLIETPTILEPNSSTQNGFPAQGPFVSSAFNSVNGTETHVSSDWQFSTNNAFTTIVHQSIQNTVSKTSYSVPANTFASNNTFYVRVRHRGQQGISQYSAGQIFTTAGVNTPVITSPTNTASNVSTTGPFTTNAFSSTAQNSETHVSSDWQFSLLSDFSSIAHQSIGNTSQLISYTPPIDALLNNTTYYLRARHTGSTSGNSNYSNTTVFNTIPSGQQSFTTPGNFNFQVPAGVTSVSVVAIGGGGGGASNTSGTALGGTGGWLSYRNNISVTPGSMISIVVGPGGIQSTTQSSRIGGDSIFNNGSVVAPGGFSTSAPSGTSFQGGVGSFIPNSGGAGGGAGGYSGVGGDGGSNDNAVEVGDGGLESNGLAGQGGAGGGGYARDSFGAGGGGVGVEGQGVSGLGGTTSSRGGKGGSGGANGSGLTGGVTNPGGSYGGGGAGGGSPISGNGGHGAVRIIWPGNTRRFPSTRTADE